MDNEKIDIIYAGDRMRTRCVYLSLLSLLRRSSKPFRVHIFTMTVKERKRKGEAYREEDIQVLRAMMNKYSPQSTIDRFDLTEQYLKHIRFGKNNNTYYSPYTMARLFAEDVLPDVQRAVYIDDDTMGNGDLASIEKFDLTHIEMGVVLDWLTRFWGNRKYFNAGVLYLNLDEIRKTGLFKKALELVYTKKMMMPDQDALNKLCHERIYLPERFNNQRTIHPDTVISHYPKRFFRHFHPVKPWDIKRMHKVYKIHNFDEDYKIYEAEFPFEKYGLARPGKDD
jgi:lipopolysaccharide biosynthesis glycosyltransferase